MKKRKVQEFLSIIGLLFFLTSPLPIFPSPVRTDDLKRRAEEWIKRGDMELESQNPRVAFTYFQQSLNLARRLNDHSLVSRSLLSLGQACLASGKLEKGLSIAEEALSIAREANNQPQEAWALDEVGNAYFYLGDYTKALEHFRRSRTLMHELGDRSGEATTLRDIGITQKLLGRFDEAFDSLLESLQIFRQVKAKNHILSILENLGTGYASVGEYGLALDYYNQALQGAREDHNTKLSLSVLSRMGYLYKDLNKPFEAHQYFQKVLEVAEPKGLLYQQAWILPGVSWALHKFGRWDDAIQAQQRCLSLNRQMKREPDVAADLQGFGILYLDRDPQVAIGYFRQALAIFYEYDSPFIHSAYAGLAGAYRRLRDFDGAVQTYEKSLDRLESVRGQLALAHQKATFLEKHQHIYQELVETLLEGHDGNPKAGNNAHAFAILERARARALVEAIAETRLDARARLRPDLTRLESQLSSRMAELQKRLIRANLTVEERRQILDNLNQAEQEFDRLAIEIRAQNPRYASLKYPAPLSLEQAQALLDNSSMLLAYMMTENQVLVFLLGAEDFHVEQLTVHPKTITARVQNYIDLIAQDGDAGWQDVSRRLYAELVEPIREHFPTGISRLVIIPDGVLHYLPFETLLSMERRTKGEERGERNQGRSLTWTGASRSVSGSGPAPHYLLEDFAISYVPSATALAELRAAKPALAATERTDLLMFADPALEMVEGSTDVARPAREQTRALYDDEGLRIMPIPFSVAEARAIAPYAGSGSEIYTGSQASELRLKTEPLDRFRVLHFASHGLISQRTPARSALVLASGSEDTEDGFLQTREIYQLKLNSDLVVLSGCQTARGRVLFGEGVQGLAQAFFYAGAQSVVASLWNVSDERTVTFMAAFYRHLADGQSKAEALRAAKLDMLRGSKTSAPRYWAPFILLGEADGHVPLRIPSWWHQADRWLLLAFVLLLIASAGLFLFRGIHRFSPH